VVQAYVRMEKSGNTAETVAGPACASTIKGNHVAGIAVVLGSVSTANISHVARNAVELATANLMVEKNRVALTAEAPPCVTMVKGGQDARSVADLIYAHTVDKRISVMRSAESPLLVIPQIPP